MGHGDHWECVWPPAEEAVGTLLPWTVENGEMMSGTRRRLPISSDVEIEVGSRTFEATPFALVADAGPFQSLCVLVPNNRHGRNEVWTGYPFASAGLGYRLTIEGIHEWENGIEAEISAQTADGLPVTFFDLHYFRNADRYELGETYPFILGAMAFKLQPADRGQFEITDPKIVRQIRALDDDLEQDGVVDLSPVAIETEGAAIMLPIEGWDAFEYTIQAPVKSVVEREFDGRRFYEVRATVLRMDQDLDLPILAAEHVIEGGVPKVGQDIAGGIWVHGYLAEPGDNAPPEWTSPTSAA